MLVAEFIGFKPTTPWPGGVSKTWEGVCIREGHECSIRLDNMIQGNVPCAECRSADRIAKRVAELRVVASERGDEIIEGGMRRISGGKVGEISTLHLTVRYACGHQSGDLAIPAGNYIYWKSGCGTCRPNTLVPGLNDLATARPDLALELAVPWDPRQLTVFASRVQVDWDCAECGKRWRATPGSRSILESGCPVCNEQFGYDSTLPGMLYVVHGVSKTTRELIIKAGITNNARHRLYTHKRRGLDTLMASLTWSDGTVAEEVERHWTQKIRKPLPKHLKPTKRDLIDGYREAVIDSDEARAAIRALLEFARAYSPETLTEEFLGDSLGEEP